MSIHEKHAATETLADAMIRPLSSDEIAQVSGAECGDGYTVCEITIGDETTTHCDEITDGDG